MDLGQHFKDSPVICFEGSTSDRAEELADTILHISKTHIVLGYYFSVGEAVPGLPSVSVWKAREELVDFIRTKSKNSHIAFIVFGRCSSPNVRANPTCFCTVGFSELLARILFHGGDL
jgi:hypothetical protein